MGTYGVDIHRERGYFTATRPGTGQLPNCKIASVRATAVTRIAAVVGVGKWSDAGATPMIGSPCVVQVTHIDVTLVFSTVNEARTGCRPRASTY